MRRRGNRVAGMQEEYRALVTTDLSQPRLRKERKGNADKRRRQVLDAAYRSIMTHGLSRTTLATIAAEAGLSQGVAVFYFKSKSGVLTEALRDLYEVYTAHWREALAASGDDPVAQLHAIVTADFDPKVCNPQVLSVWFAFWGEQSFIPSYTEITQDYAAHRTAAINDICRRLIPKSREKAEDIALWVDTFTDGLWQNLHLSPDTISREASRDATLRLLAALLPEHSERLLPKP